MAKRNLVYVRAGDNSLHSSWIVPREKRNYDLFVSYFGNRTGMFQEDGEYYETAAGLKFPSVTRLLKEKPELIYSYDAIWIPDDDLLTCAEQISRMFELFHKHKLQLAQPALAPGSYMAHPVTAMVEGKSLHFTRYVEVMCPVFSRFALKKLAHTFSLTVSSWGIDFLWAHQLGYPSKRIAVLDETPVVHTRPVGKGSFYDALKGKKVNPADESLKIMRKYKLAKNWDVVRKRSFGSIPLSNARRVSAGDWASLHFLQEMIDPSARFPIFYENRSASLPLKASERPNFGVSPESHSAGLSISSQSQKSETSLSRTMTTNRRVQAIARDFVKHWTVRRRMRAGKALIVCRDRQVCGELMESLARLRPSWKEDGIIANMATADRSEPEAGASRGALIARFNDPQSPLQIAVVDNIWSSEWTCPVLDTLYLDVPVPVDKHIELVKRLMDLVGHRLATLVVDYLGLSDVAFQPIPAAGAARLAVPKPVVAPPRSVAGPGHTAGQRIAHLFLIRCNLNHEAIWKDYFHGQEGRYEIYVHAKQREEMTSELLRGRHIPHWCETEYAHASLVEAELLLLEEALKNKENAFFLLHSESCLPIRSFDYTYRHLFDTGCSWVNYFKGDMWRYYGVDMSSIRHDRFFKAPQFFCLTRNHAELVLANGKLEQWQRCHCADEHYIPTVLANAGRLEECLRRNLTFADWNPERRESPSGPTVFHKLLPADVKALRRSDSLFARKFALDSDIGRYLPFGRPQETVTNGSRLRGRSPRTTQARERTVASVA